MFKQILPVFAIRNIQDCQENIHLDVTVLAAYLDGSSYRDSTNCDSTCLSVCLFVFCQGNIIRVSNTNLYPALTGLQCCCGC